MSRPSIMTGGFHPHGVGHGHVHHGGHYGVHAQSAYGSAIHSGLTYGRPLPIRAPVLPPAFNHQHTGQHQHGRTSTFSMADPAFMTAEEEHAYLQKLSNEYEPEATVSPMSIAVLLTEYGKLTAAARVRLSASARAALPSPPSMPTPILSTESRLLLCRASTRTSVLAAVMATADGEVSCFVPFSLMLCVANAPSYCLHVL